MARRNREEEIIGAIRKYLIDAVKRLDPITDERLMEVSKCARATYYKYVTNSSAIESEINLARTKQKIYADSVGRSKDDIEHHSNLRKRLHEAEEGSRALLAFISRMTTNLIMKGVDVKVIHAAQREAMPHPNRSYSRAGKGRHRK